MFVDFILLQVGVDDKDFGKILLKYPWILSTSIQENYKEVLSFFEMEKVRCFQFIRACFLLHALAVLLG